jgi:hypothetical protein
VGRLRTSVGRCVGGVPCLVQLLWRGRLAAPPPPPPPPPQSSGVACAAVGIVLWAVLVGQTNGDNEVWNLAKDAVHYDAIVAVMNLREVRVCAGAGARRRADWEVGGVWLCSSRPML